MAVTFIYLFIVTVEGMDEDKEMKRDNGVKKESTFIFFFSSSSGNFVLSTSA